MTKRTFSDIDNMLTPAALSGIVGVDIISVEREPIATEGFSDNLLERVTCKAANDDDAHLILKHFNPNDWIGSLTSDTGLREISLFEEGWYDQLPRKCWTPMIGSARGASGSALLMQDVSDGLFPPGDEPISEHELETCLNGFSSLHADNWGGRAPVGPIDLCTTDEWLGLLTPEVGRRRVELGVDNGVTASLEAGWQLFTENASRDAANTIAAIHRDNTPLLDGLAAAPQTLNHGDLKLANLGIDSDLRLIMLDWALFGSMSPFIDLGWFLAVNSARLPITKEAIVQRYRILLQERGIDLGTEWVRHSELGMLAGGTLRLGWVKALGTLAEDDDTRVRETKEFDWWCDMTERAARWL